MQKWLGLPAASGNLRRLAVAGVATVAGFGVWLVWRRSFSQTEPHYLQSVRSRSVELLDGGTGEELIRQGVPDDRKIWSAVAVEQTKYHKKLIDVHASFILAGSRYFTVNNYAIVPGVGFSKEQVQQLTDLAGKLANEARQKALEKLPPNTVVKICGTLPPLVESYRPDLIMHHKQGVEWYSLIASTLAPHVDIFLAETISSSAEMSMAAEAVLPFGKPFFASYSLRPDGRLHSGEDVSSVVLSLLSLPAASLLQAVLFNCSTPEAISTALSSLHTHNNTALTQLRSRGVKLGAYANRLVPLTQSDWTFCGPAQPLRQDLNPNQYCTQVLQWVDKYHLQLVGGCCGIGPEYIAALKEQLAQRGWLQHD
eukprot:gb/GEZN01010348.1/.p1 GENE.gb/GEZN01010348.1/~~gb/GEZN01010348.1/.p1  ORF type:complete len:368 (+),score=47.90 gb/GEZN01010348.1/:84-1187(+)